MKKEELQNKNGIRSKRSPLRKNKKIIAVLLFEVNLSFSLLPFLVCLICNESTRDGRQILHTIAVFLLKL